MSCINFKDEMEASEGLLKAIGTGLINHRLDSNPSIQPKLVYNDQFRKVNVAATLNEELNSCIAYWMAVAFVTPGGLAQLKMAFRDAHLRGVKGRIITTTYLHFNSPKVLRDLLAIPNLEVRICEEQLHIKGYYFNHGYYGNLLVGSANITADALATNYEWNVKISTLKEGALVLEANEGFEAMWKASRPLTEEWIQKYEPYYVDTRRAIQKAKVVPMETIQLQPNKMQIEAMHSLQELRRRGKDRSLLISATGTGKTYLSAFDVRSFLEKSPEQKKRVLFLAHREQLLKQAQKSYSKVMPHIQSSMILSGNTADKKVAMASQFVFATVQTMAKTENLAMFTAHDFDYIVIDEVHHAGAKTYQSILGHFKAEFLLGMTATPERSDGSDIYKLFDYNIAFEIRLQQALESDLLCPFHYYGIEEIRVNGELLSDHADFNNLVSDERVRHILKEAAYFSYSGKRVKGLVFCSTLKEAEVLAKKFTEQGVPSTFLCGDHSQEERQETIQKLTTDQEDGYYNYIFTVDIFNEGVDIPEINQVIMLRPTESAIIFVQQLGRGLRKHDHKEYVVILDFIGNYEKSFLIPIALSGDRSHNKDNIRYFVAEGSKFLPGKSSVSLSEITKKRIYEAIDTSQWNQSKQLKQAYDELKKKLGRIPQIIDFERFGTMDIVNYFENKTYGSYYTFLVKYEKAFTHRLDETQEAFMNFLCTYLAKGKRPYELHILKGLLYEEEVPFPDYKYKRNIEDIMPLVSNVSKILGDRFYNQSSRRAEAIRATFIEEDARLISKGIFRKSSLFIEALKDSIFRDMLEEVIDYGLRQYDLQYKDTYHNTDFVLYKKYTYREVCAFLLWQQDVNAQNIGGYKYDELTNTFPVFINYKKEDTIQDSIKYEDRFLNDQELIALSKSRRDRHSKDIMRIENAEKNQTCIYLFLRKNKEDMGSKEFYFLGAIKPTGQFEEVIMESGDKAVEIHYRLRHPVRKDLYDYFTMD